MSGRERCIWCGEDWPKFYRDKPYCVQCTSGCKRECRTCHKPYPELRFFKNGADQCNSCESRWERKQMKKMGGLKLQVVDSTTSPFHSSRSPSPMSYSNGESTEGFKLKPSSSSEKMKKKRKRRMTSSRRIESDTEEEEAGGEEEEVGHKKMTTIVRMLKSSSSNRNQCLRRRVNSSQQTRMKKGLKK